MSEIMLIGIHGLLNKPQQKELETWWAVAMAEGLKRNCNLKANHHNICGYLRTPEVCDCIR